MEGSTGVAPAAADANGDVQAPDALAPETPQTDPNELAGQPPADPDSPEARLAAAEKRAKDAEARVSEFEANQPPDGPTDLLSALEGEEDLGLSPEDLAAFQNGQQPGAQETTDEQVKEFEAYLDERIQERLSPLQEERATERIQAWQSEHPDVKPGSPIFNELLATMKTMGEQYGEAATKDVSLINLAYTAAKAKLADAGAKPAESVASNGASLETQPGGSQTGEPNQDDDYKKALLGGNPRDGAGFR